MSLLRRRMMMAIEGDGSLRYKMGEFIGDGTFGAIIEHGLGEVPFVFMFVGEEIGNETAETFGGMWMNTGATTRYTSTVSKDWTEVGISKVSDGINVLSNVSPSSASYGVQAVDENTIVIHQCANKQIFTLGKTYKWIAIADWR